MSKKDTESEIAYLITLALTVGRLCVTDSDLEAARTVLQKAADYVELLRGLPSNTVEGGLSGQRATLEAEYLAMRTALVSHPRIDVANTR